MKHSFFLILCISIIVACGNQVKSPDQAESVTPPPIENVKKTKASKSDLEFLTGHFDPTQHPDFTKIDPLFADKDDRLMQKEAYTAFKKMFEAAKKDGVHLKIKSATRNFDYQKGIWERKWKGETLLSDGTNVSKDIEIPKEKAMKILEYSSMPGTSRHHWGTDIDLNAFENSWFDNGEGLKLYTWMQAHGHEYGYCQPYTEKGSGRPDGYNEEKWHWSYTPLSDKYTLMASEHLEDKMISGFAGSATAAEIGVVKKYILGINHTCTNH